MYACVCVWVGVFLPFLCGCVFGKVGVVELGTAACPGDRAEVSACQSSITLKRTNPALLFPLRGGGQMR